MDVSGLSLATSCPCFTQVAEGAPMPPIRMHAGAACADNTAVKRPIFTRIPFGGASSRDSDSSSHEPDLSHGSAFCCCGFTRRGHTQGSAFSCAAVPDVEFANFVFVGLRVNKPPCRMNCPHYTNQIIAFFPRAVCASQSVSTTDCLLQLCDSKSRRLSNFLVS